MQLLSITRKKHRGGRKDSMPVNFRVEIGL